MEAYHGDECDTSGTAAPADGGDYRKKVQAVKCIHSSRLLQMLASWSLPDSAEVATLNKFHRSASFNSFRQEQPLLTSILGRSGLSAEALGVVNEGVRVDQLLTLKYQRPSGSKIFGESLAALVHDYRTCHLALIEPRLGIPVVLDKVSKICTVRSLVLRLLLPPQSLTASPHPFNVRSKYVV